jgi:hypothetical protein
VPANFGRIASPIRPDLIFDRHKGFSGEIVSAGTFTHNGTAKEYLVFYERGIGTGGFFDSFRGRAFGAGLARYIRRAYKFYHRCARTVSPAAPTAPDHLRATSAPQGFSTRILYSSARVQDLAFLPNPPQDRMPSTGTELAGFVHHRHRFRRQLSRSSRHGSGAYHGSEWDSGSGAKQTDRGI